MPLRTRPHPADGGAAPTGDTSTHRLLHRAGDEEWVARLRPGLRLLLDAFRYMADVAGPPAEFAVDRELLLQLGLTPIDLAWLGHRTYVTQLVGVAPTTRPAFVLTDAGVEFVALILGTAAPSPAPPPECPPTVPTWDTRLRTLRWHDRVVKQFRVPAPNQELILTAFEEEGWPPQIDDPLPRASGLDPKQRLHDTITSLNRNRKCAAVKFSGDGTGSAVRWVASTG